MLPSAARTLALLALITLVPRLVMATKLSAICPDGTHYIAAAGALERGDCEGPALLKFNVYPAILALLHAAGLSWEWATKLCGVAAATLLVWPLFGWVRRQFDDRVATISCLLYATHPKLIDWSPEAVRDPLYWLFLTVGLYASWRAATEVRRRWYLAAGGALALATLTRAEGAVLLVPLVSWSAVRFRHLRLARGRMIAGVLLAVFALPILAACALPYVLPGKSLADVLHLAPWQRIERLFVERTGPEVPSLASELWSLVHVVERGLGPVFGLLLFGGWFAWWRLFQRADHVPLTVASLLIGLGILVHIRATGEASSRYPLAAVIMSTRCAALGLLSFNGWLSRRAQVWRLLEGWRLGLPLAAASLVFAIGLCDALSARFDRRNVHAHLGEWIRERFGEHRQIVGVYEPLSVVGYHAAGRPQPLPRGLRGDALLAAIEQGQPDVLILTESELASRDRQAVLAQRRRWSLDVIDPAELPAGMGPVLLLGKKVGPQTTASER